MGVQGLWELVAPVGRRVSVETLAGKKLAIDASIWMVQFMKAMRDEKGEMVRNAHLIGFFRRICKLLFLRTKPVFIFDGGTPSLKRRTVIARRRQRENAQTKLRKTAEKLLLNNLKAMRLKELAENLENQRKENDLKRKNAVPEVAKNTDNQKEKHDLKGISVVTENNEVMDNISNSKEPKGNNVVPELVKDVEKNDLKGKSVMIDDIEVSDSSSKSSDNATRRFDQEALDAMLAASLAEEEDEGVIGNSTASVRDVIFSEEEEDDDGDEEMVLPVMDGKVDPAVLAALPPSMQLDLLVQMRERLMAENRQKYQKVKKAPAEFSELQIQSYLKTVAFRREINEVQKSASGKDMGGVQTSRIASEANREYIFSSSFTGDKQTLASAGAEKIGNVEHRTSGKRPAFFDSINHVSSVSLPSSALESAANEPISNLNDVETYVDERGRLRVSRVRAMGIRMTRDLQRNLDLMKEKENDSPEQREAIFNKIVLGEPGTFSLNNHHLEASTEGHGVISSFSDEVQRECPQVVPNRTPMNISFLEDEIVSRSTDEDDLFAHLVAGGSVSSVNNDLQSKHPFDTASDCSWEEGIIDEKTVNFSNDVGNCQMSIEKENINDDTEVDWEEGICDATENGLVSPVAHNKASPRVSLEEEADMDEAIRRSLNDCTRDMSMFTSFEKENFEVSRETAKQNTLVRDLTIEEEEDDLVHLPRENDTLPSQVSYEAVAGSQKLDHMVVKDKPQTFNIVERQFALSGEIDTKYDENGKLLHKPCEEKVVSKYATSKCGRDTPGSDPVSPLELKGGHLIAVPSLNTSVGGGEEFSFVGSNCSSKISSHVPAAVRGDTTEVNLVDARQNDFEATPTCHSYETTEIAKSLEEPFTKELASSAHTKQNLAAEKNLVVLENQTSITKEASTNQINMEDPIEVSEASLDEEMLLLRQERLDLGDEQRKLERNAESVSGEMFAECQELLQMFGLPYIIAPMEAEAQCAFLELAKLVDGVVTDDSDVFLFGARSVYKNIFDDRKYVETYFMKDIESELGLTREQLIRMALLLGSDYTEGVSGIGIVNAIEVVHAFPEEDGLVKFREWLESPDPSILGKLDTQSGSGSRKKVSNVRNSDADCLKGVDGGFAGGGNVSEGHDNEHSIDNLQKTKQVFMDNHRNVSKNWHIPSSFPSEAVVSAYVSPQVDQSTESFSWGKPDLSVLRKLCWEKFGWTNQKADDLLLPVLKEYNKHETQLRLEAFYTFNERFAKIRSRRIKKAVKGITGKRSSEVVDDVPTEASRKRTTPRHSKRKEKSNVEQDSIVENECSISEKPTPKQSRRRKMETTPLSDEVGEPSTQKKERCSTKKGSSGAARGRGKGRGRGRGRGKGKEAPGYESTETISSNRSNSSDELEKQDGKIERPYEVRKSTRPRNNANYMENDSETPGLSKYVDQINIDDDIDGAVEREPVCDAGANGGEPVPEDGDYLEMGGGFCLDEDKQENDTDQFVSTSTRRLSDREKSNLPLEGRFSEDYLAMGGGFCEDESELHNETVQPISSPVRNLDEVTTGTRIDPLPTTLDPPNCIDVHDTIKAGELQEDRLPEADSITFNSGLTAIPFLKRKRRKM